MTESKGHGAMQVGIKKLQENEWLVHIGCARIKMNRFAVELLNITLEHLTMLENGQSHSTFESYIKLGLRLSNLDDRNLQKVLSEIDSVHILNLLLAANSPDFAEHILQNMGAILANQLRADLEMAIVPDEFTAKKSIQAVVEKMLRLEEAGEIVFINKNTITRYI